MDDTCRATERIFHELTSIGGGKRAREEKAKLDQLRKQRTKLDQLRNTPVFVL
ncbi:hypothetical protein Bca4012_090295 [Brassica carinata]|uniref:Uncharacterized protein n=1 Tax=Brassica carinata TaxID=52824 RepID=A0A8X7PBM3_BRACI|nr:hypothetical protein Bca52824_086357 [Brassica carinata]